MRQISLSDYEYSNRKKRTKRDKFLEIKDENIPWNEWIGGILPFYCEGQCDRPPKGVETMLRMYLLHFQHLLEGDDLNKLFFNAINRVMVTSGHMIKDGTIMDATGSTKNAEKKRDLETHQARNSGQRRLRGKSKSIFRYQLDCTIFDGSNKLYLLE